MNKERVAGGRRRSAEEGDALAAAYESSGLTRREFSRRHGVAVWTLDYYRKRRRQRASGAGSCGTLLAVELAAGERGTIEAPRGDGGALAVVLRQGRRIEVPRGFDAGTLEQLIGVLERL